MVGWLGYTTKARTRRARVIRFWIGAYGKGLTDLVVCPITGLPLIQIIRDRLPSLLIVLVTR